MSIKPSAVRNHKIFEQCDTMKIDIEVLVSE